MQYSEQKLRWLETILSERLVDDIVLRPSSKNSVYLHLQGCNNHIEIRSNDLQNFSSNSKKNNALWDYDCFEWKSVFGDKIIAPGCYELDDPLIRKTDYGYIVGYDVLGLIYFMFSRIEEVDSVDLDQHARFPSTSSHAFKHGYLEIPIVDVWIDIIGQVMQRLWPFIKLKLHNFSIKVSHDVDVPSRYIFQNFSGMFRRMAGDILKRGDFLSAFSAPYVRLQSHDRLPVKDSLNKFNWLMDLSERHNLTSAFYFICGKSHRDTDADYEVGHPAIRSLMREIHARGHEIGLHPSYNTYQTPGAIVDEAKELRRVCAEENILQSDWGGRMHYLRWSQPATLHGWENAQMSYDSTLGYADHVGFRCGTCFEYPAYDPVLDKQLNLRIRPLIAMDVTILSKGYMGLGTSKDAYDKLTALKDACRTMNGTFYTFVA